MLLLLTKNLKLLVQVEVADCATKGNDSDLGLQDPGELFIVHLML